MADARVSEAPFNEINVTPFIDIMLVLIVVMLLSLPIMTHKLPVDLPVGSNPGIEEPHKLAIDRGGALSFDGKPVSDAQLPAILTAMRDRPNAVLHMQPDPEARYDRFDAVLAVVKRAGITRLGFIGNKPFEE